VAVQVGYCVKRLTILFRLGSLSKDGDPPVSSEKREKRHVGFWGVDHFTQV